MTVIKINARNTQGRELLHHRWRGAYSSWRRLQHQGTVLKICTALTDTQRSSQHRCQILASDSGACIIKPLVHHQIGAHANELFACAQSIRSRSRVFPFACVSVLLCSHRWSGKVHLTHGSICGMYLIRLLERGDIGTPCSIRVNSGTASGAVAELSGPAVPGQQQPCSQAPDGMMASFLLCEDICLAEQAAGGHVTADPAQARFACQIWHLCQLRNQLLQGYFCCLAGTHIGLRSFSSQARQAPFMPLQSSPPTFCCRCVTSYY